MLDDEPDLASLLGESLFIMGLTPTVCTQPQQALELIEQRAFDLVFSDLRMPLWDGCEFYKLAVQKNPALVGRFVFVTGDVCNAETRVFLQSSGNAHSSKPIILPKSSNCSRNCCPGVPRSDDPSRE